MLKCIGTVLTLIILTYGCSTNVYHVPPTDEKQLSQSETSTITQEKELDLVIDYDTSLWTEMIQIVPQIEVDLAYATDANFTGNLLYHCNRCFLEKQTALALAEVHAYVKTKGYNLKLFDCFRPSVVQNALWTAKPNRRYVMSPAKGSNHSRGIAVDVTLVDSSGKQLEMGTPFDHFGPESHTDHKNLSKEILANRQILKEAMQKFGFKGIRTEWWHFSLVLDDKPEVSDWEWPCYD